MPRESMTPRERWLAVLSGQKPDRVPLDYRSTPEFTKALLTYLGTDLEGMYRRLHIDKTVTVAPRYVGPPIPADGDVFGCRYTEVNYGTGSYRECIYGPLAQYRTLAEIEANYTWPDPDWWDYSGIVEQIKGKEDLPVQGGGSEPFLTYCHLRGQQQAYMDLIESPDIVHYCLDKLYGLCYTNTQRIYEQIPGKVLITGVAEDMGTQESLIFSPAQIREFFFPHMKRMMDLAHEAGAYVMTHSDGAVRAIIPELIEIGMDVLDPVQWRCRGMEREGLKRDFGDRIAFHGAMDNQYTLAFGSEEEVRQEVRDNIRILGEGGGFILGPCHNIQPVTPPERIVAMYEEAYASGWS
ncbi:MAG: uroporphyrinogen decarboxylase family protein [Anaerolineae bacterium]|jgi:uroporphyrinogen decarboxylase